MPAAAHVPKKVYVKRWCYTNNNPTAPLAPECVYHIYGEEIGESGTPHHQGFIIFNKQMTLNSVKLVSHTAHWEPAKGTNAQASDYCKKEGKFHESGILPDDPNRMGGAATKRKYADAFEKAKNGELDEIDVSLRTRYYRTYKEIEKDHMPPLPPLDDTCGIWYYGETGAGKSLRARTEYPDAYFKRANKWWDGYQKEEAVILDDLDLTHVFIAHDLKIWADRYSFKAETKGGMMNIRPKVLIVTSQYQIHEIFKDSETDNALSRRFKEIKIG